MTIQETLTTTAILLAGYSDAPNIDAQRMVLFALQKSEAAYLIAHSEEGIPHPIAQKIQRMIALRKTGMPLAYILGEADFYGRTFTVTPDVLIPRPDTENLIDHALSYIKENFSDTQEFTIADIGTGSGCIAITLALELAGPHPLPLPEQERETTTYPTSPKGFAGRCHLIAIDISSEALNIARKNAVRHGVADRIEFMCGDMLEPMKDRPIDLIVSNPPYLPAEALAKAGRSVDTNGLLFEPPIALDGGPDGLNFVNQIKASGIPAIVETVGGEIVEFGL